jgi:hypothetical protein
VIEFKKIDWHTGTARFKQRLLKWLLLDAVMAIVIILGAEGALRRFMPELQSAIFTPDLTGGFPKRTNSFGLRDREFPRQKPSNEFRIVALGNSTTYGTGIAEEDTYPKQLERLLGSSSFLVVNGGGEGTSVAKAMRFLERDGLSFGPEAVILAFSPTMVATTRGKGEVNDSLLTKTTVSNRDTKWDPRLFLLSIHRQLYASYAYVFWDQNIRKRLYRAGILSEAADKKSGGVYAYAFGVPNVDRDEIETTYAAIGRQIDDLNRILKIRGIRLLVVSIPSRFELSSDTRDNERNLPVDKIRIRPSQRLKSDLERGKIEFVDLLPRLRQERQDMLAGRIAYDPLFIDGDYSHLNKRGNTILAELLRNVLHPQHP